MNNKEQEERLMNGRGKANGTIEDETFGKFLFNKDKGTCLGRSAKSWAQILGFYVVFYSLLAAFWVGCLAIFLKTLDDKVPRYYGKGTIIGLNPGVGYQPWMLDDPDSTLIKFNINDNTSYAKYVKALDKYLEKYSNISNTRICEGDQSNADFIKDGSATLDGAGGEDDIVPACRFNLTEFVKAGCGHQDAYGFKAGKPCIILSLNRLIGWRPVDYTEDSVPEPIRGRYKPNFVTLHCDGTSDFDKEYIGKLTYIPEAGIDGRYYPYAVMQNYHQPIAMVKFENLPRNKLVLVECRAFAQNIEHDITAKLGLVNFEMLVEDLPVNSNAPVESR